MLRLYVIFDEKKILLIYERISFDQFIVSFSFILFSLTRERKIIERFDRIKKLKKKRFVIW